MAVSKAPGDGLPLSRILRAIPLKPPSRFLWCMRRLRFGPPPLVRLQAQNVGDLSLPQLPFEVGTLSVNGVGHHRPKRDTPFSCPMDKVHPDLWLGAQSGIGLAPG